MSYKVKDVIKLFSSWTITRQHPFIRITNKNVSFCDKNIVDEIMECEPLTEFEEKDGCIVILVASKE